MAEDNGWFLTDQFRSPANVRVHEETTGAEILEKTNGPEHHEERPLRDLVWHEEVVEAIDHQRRRARSGREMHGMHRRVQRQRDQPTADKYPLRPR